MCPSYDYSHLDTDDCSNCSKGVTFEIFESITKESMTICPECNGPVKRLIVPGSGFILAGGGWFKDNYSSQKSTPKVSETKVETKIADKNSNPATSKESKTYKKEK